MTTAITPFGIGDFDPRHPRTSNEEHSPPTSSHLPRLQTHPSGGSQWNKNIWGFSTSAGAGFGAVGRPRDFEDRRSPSLLSPTGNGPSPWLKPYQQKSPIDPCQSEFGTKRTTILPDTLESNDRISPTLVNNSQTSTKALPSPGLSINTQGLQQNSLYRRPSEVNSARPTFGRLGSFVTSPRDGFEEPGRKSLAAWGTQSADVNRQTQPSFATQTVPTTRELVQYGRRPSGKSEQTDALSDQSTWSSLRQALPQDRPADQRSRSYTSSFRPSLPRDNNSDLEARFDRVYLADESQFTPTFSHWQPEKDIHSAYNSQTYTSGIKSPANPEGFRGVSPSAWRNDAVPRSFGSSYAQSQQQDYSGEFYPLLNGSQRSFEPGQRQLVDHGHYRAPQMPQANEYGARHTSNGLDPQVPPSFLQLDRKLVLNAQDHEEYLQHYMQHILPAQLRGQYFAGLPYGLATMPHAGLPPYMPMPHVPAVLPAQPSPISENNPGLRSALLEEYLNSMKNNGRRYELRDIYEHIVEFSGNQHGSKFIQNKLETATSDEKERVFREIMPNAIQLMKDVYGNYVIQKVFERGDQSQKTALFNVMSGKVYELSCQVYGCRVVQTALMHVLVHQQAAMVDELRNHVLDCVRDQNGNHVIQIVVKHVPTDYTKFVVDAFIGQIQHLATHPYGCRVVQRLLDHCVEPGRTQILRELHACASALVSDQYGNYVTQHVLEHGCPEDRAKIVALVRQHLVPYSKQKFASNVVEKCLTFGNDEQRRDIMLQLSAKGVTGESNLPLLIKDSFGNYVIQRLLDTLSPPDYAQFVDILAPELAALRRLTPNNKQVDNVAKKMYRHDMPYGIPHYNNNPALHPIRTDTANSTPALTLDETSPYSTSLPSVADETAQNGKDSTLNMGPDIRIEVTDH